MDEAAQNFHLNPAHELDVDLLQGIVPEDPKLGVFLLQQPQHGQQLGLVGGGGHPVGHDALQPGLRSGGLQTIALADEAAGQTGDSTKLSGENLLHGGEFFPGIEPDLLYFLLSQQGADLQTAAGDLQPGQAAALRIPGDFINFCPKFFGIFPDRGISIQHFQKLRHAAELQPGTKAAGKQTAAADKPGDIPGADGAGFQEAVQQSLVAQGDIFRDYFR